MIRELIPENDPRLRCVSSSVDWGDEDWESLHELLRDLRETMDAAGGIGIAAPQVGVNKRIILVYSEPHGKFLEMVNPEVWYSRSTVLGGEGCLSLPGRACEVERSESVVCSWYTPDGRPQMFRFDGLSARVVQHEVDHLNGVLMVDHT